MHTHSNSLKAVAEQLQRHDATPKATEDHKKLYQLICSIGKVVLEGAYIAVSSGKSKTVTVDHLMLLAKLETFFEKNTPLSKDTSNSKKGGAVRLPSEYFGINSGRYQPRVPMGHDPWVSPHLTRTGLYANNPPFRNNMVGGNDVISDELVAEVVKKYNSNKGKADFEMRVSKEAMPYMKKLIIQNLVECLSSKGKKVSHVSEKDVRSKVSFKHIA